MKFYRMVGDNSGTTRVDLSDFDPRSRSLELKKSKSVLRITPIKIFVESRDKN